MSAATRCDMSRARRQLLRPRRAGLHPRRYRSGIAGTVIVGHGNRMMAYPTGGFNNANTAGGPVATAGLAPMQTAGCVSSQMQPGVEYIQTAAGAGTAITSLTDGQRIADHHCRSPQT